jgi:hypothetical protein
MVFALRTAGKRSSPARAACRLLAGSLCALGSFLLAGCSQPSTPDTSPDASVTPGVCVGVKPPASAWSAQPSGGGDADAGELDAGPALGASLPKWALRDFQPQSCGYGAVYGPDVFHGEVTVLTFFEAG